MVFGRLKQCLNVVSLIVLITLSIVSAAWAGKFLNELLASGEYLWNNLCR